MQAAPITVRQAAAKTSNHIKTTNAPKPKLENFRLGAANKNGSLKTNNKTILPTAIYIAAKLPT